MRERRHSRHLQPFVGSRREFLHRSSVGFGSLALASMLGAKDEADRPLAPKRPHFEPTAKRVIFMFMHGGPSHIDTFDPKPELDRAHGQPLPFDRPLTFAEGSTGALMRSPWAFKRYGESGLPVSELFPHVAQHVDKLCIVRSMVGDSVAHGGAVLQLNTGSNTFTRPSMGAWVVYGLGTENENLPAFLTLKPGLSHGGAKNWSSGFLPGVYQGTPVGHGGVSVDGLMREPIEHLQNSRLTPAQQRFELDMIQKRNRASLRAQGADPDLEARIEALELAFRMQTEAPQAFDISKETAATKRLYGLDDDYTRDFGWQCLMARRLAERDVRFIQISHEYGPGNEVGWDAHSELIRLHTRTALMVDKPIAGLLADLESRGLLEDTLVVWGGEFGRTPISQAGDGRDHNPYGYTMWLAGGGVRGGMAYGATDELGYYAVEDRMHIHDLHATILHALGLDHEKLTYFHSGRNFRLTDVAGVVAKRIFA